MEEASVCGNVTIYGGKVSNTDCLFALAVILYSIYTNNI